MKQLAAFARFLHFSNLLVCVAMATLCFQTALLLDWLFIPEWFYLFIFSSTFLLFCLRDLNYKKAGRLQETRAAFLIRYSKYFIPFIGIALVLSGYLLFKLKGAQLSLLILPGLLAIVYCLPLDTCRSRLQQIALNWIVPVIVCSFITTVLPASFIPYGFDNKFWWLLMFRFSWLLALLFTSKIVAIKIDHPKPVNETGTMSHRNGYLLIAYAAIATAIISFFFAFRTGFPLELIIALLVSLIITVLTIRYRLRHPFSLAALLLVSLCIILQTMLVCIATLIP